MKFAEIFLALIAIAAIDTVIGEDNSVPDGTIYGHVYDAQTKQPVSGAWVYCQETKCSKQLTDNNGYYAIGNCFSPSSNYVIECTKNGYRSTKSTAATDSSGKAEVDFNLGNTPNPSPSLESNTTQVKSWEKIFGEPGNLNTGFSVQQTNNGDYIIGGCTASFSTGTYGVWLIEVDFKGNKLWDKIIDGSGIVCSVQQTSDGGFIVAVNTESYGTGNACLIKTDAHGNKLWDKTFGGSGNDVVHSVQQTNDGGYIIAGQTESYGSGNEDVWLIKTDAQGNKLWERTFGGSDIDTGYSVQQIGDGSYIIIGTTDSFGTGGRDVWLIKTDPQGNKLWDKTFGGSGNDGGYSIQQTSDGGYIIAGFMDSYVTGSEDVWLIKIDAYGNKLWDKNFGGSKLDYGNSVQQTNDGGYIIIGEVGSAIDANGFVILGNTWLIKTDAQGNMLWDRTFEGYGSGHSVQQTTDDGYIIVRDRNFDSGWGSDLRITKTDPNGN